MAWRTPGCWRRRVVGCIFPAAAAPQTEAIVGAPAVSSIQQYNFTKAFMGANGVALEAGFTTPDPEEAAVKAAAVRRARKLVPCG